jgi:hypothetical protein
MACQHGAKYATTTDYVFNGDSLVATVDEQTASGNATGTAKTRMLFAGKVKRGGMGELLLRLLSRSSSSAWSRPQSERSPGLDAGAPPFQKKDSCSACARS